MLKQITVKDKPFPNFAAPCCANIVERITHYNIQLEMNSNMWTRWKGSHVKPVWTEFTCVIWPTCYTQTFTGITMRWWGGTPPRYRDTDLKSARTGAVNCDVRSGCNDLSGLHTGSLSWAAATAWICVIEPIKKKNSMKLLLYDWMHWNNDPFFQFKTFGLNI